MAFAFYLLVGFQPRPYLRAHAKLDSLRLLRPFYADGLVDSRTFLLWLVQQMVTCNLAQAGFVAHLADEYLDGMLVSRALTRPFADACIAKLSEVILFCSLWCGLIPFQRFDHQHKVNSRGWMVCW